MRTYIFSITFKKSKVKRLHQMRKFMFMYFRALEKKLPWCLKLFTFLKFRGLYFFFRYLKVGSLKDLISCGIDGNDAPTLHVRAG